MGKFHANMLDKIYDGCCSRRRKEESFTCFLLQLLSYGTILAVERQS